MAGAHRRAVRTPVAQDDRRLTGEFYRATVASDEDEPGTPRKWLDAVDALNATDRPVSRRVGATYGSAASREMLDFIRSRGFDYAGAVYPPLLRAFFDARVLAYRTLAPRAAGGCRPASATRSACR